MGISTKIQKTKSKMQVMIKMIQSTKYKLLYKMEHLINELKEIVLGGVHAHRPHRPAQLLRADVAATIHVELIERLQQDYI